MFATPVVDCSARAEAFVARLTETALGIISPYAARTFSVTVELDLWRALRAAFRLEQHRGPRRSRRELVDALAAAAYRVALRHHPAGSFLDLELALWHGFRAD